MPATIEPEATTAAAGPVASERRPAILVVDDEPTVLAAVSRDLRRGFGERFRVLRAHAEGGLGKVSVARDRELNREVALKEIKAEYADDDGAREVFHQGAQAGDAQDDKDNPREHGAGEESRNAVP